MLPGLFDPTKINRPKTDPYKPVGYHYEVCEYEALDHQFWGLFCNGTLESFTIRDGKGAEVFCWDAED